MWPASSNPIRPMTMRKNLFLALGLICGALLVAPSLEAQQSFTSTHKTAMVDSVQQALSAFSAAMARSQWDSALAFYARRPEFRWVEEGKVVARGPEEIGKYLKSMPASMRITTTYTDTEVIPLAPGLAAVVTRFSTAMTNGDAAPITFGGMLTMTMVHTPEGWRILNGHSSAEHEQ